MSNTNESKWDRMAESQKTEWEGTAQAAMLLPQVAVPAPMTDDEKSAAWVAATIEMASHENCYLRGMLDAEAHHGIGAKP